MLAIPARRGVVAPSLCLYTKGHSQHLPAVVGLTRGLEASAAGSLRRGEHLQPCLTQHDMWVMHGPLGARARSQLLPPAGRGWEGGVPCQVTSEPETRVPRGSHIRA